MRYIYYKLMEILYFKINKGKNYYNFAFNLYYYLYLVMKMRILLFSVGQINIFLVKINI